MKKIFYCAITIIVLAACSQSHEQKAETLIREHLKKVLYKPETYKPVETKVDSAFAPYDNPALFDELDELIKIGSEIKKLETKAKDAKSSMSLWSGPYQSAFGKNEYQEAKDEYEEATGKIEKLGEKWRKKYESVASMLQGGREFIGYKAVHNYRADNNAGNTLINNAIFLIDKNFENIVYSMDIEDYNQIQKIISEFEEQMSETE